MNFFVINVKLFVYIYLLNTIGIVTGSITIFNEKNHTVDIIESVSAAFGPRITDEGFKGYIVVANPLGGCSNLEKPPSNVSYVEPDQWIVIIKRTPTIFGNCSFDLKVKNAQNAGYKAVIIYNSESDNLIKMSSSGKYNIKIPSVFISNSDGLTIRDFFTYKNHSYVVINNDDDNLNYLLIPFICVVAVCFIIAVSIFVSKFIFHIYKLRKNRFPKSALKKIPTKKYQKTDKYDTCPICLNEYEEGEKMRILPCEHIYHVECIDKWLLRNNRFCPVCKRRVLPGGSDSESEDSNDNHASATHSNIPNEDDDTNESSRLLVNVRNDPTNEDNVSAATVSTILNTVTITNETNQNNSDLNSMNNQMTSSMTTNQNKDLKSSSSRYGSISSSLNIIANNATTSKSLNEPKNDEEAGNNLGYENNMEQIDSKKTPDFHSPIDDSPIEVYSPIENDSPIETDPVSHKVNEQENELTNSTSIKNNTQSDLPQVFVKSIKKNSKKNKKNNQLQEDTELQNEEKNKDDENVLDSNDKQTLLRKKSKSKKSKKKSQASSSNQADSQNDRLDYSDSDMI